VSSKKELSQPERTGLKARRAALHRDILKFTLAQGEYMPHIKWARANDDFTFEVIHGSPPLGSLTSLQAVHTSAAYSNPIRVSPKPTVPPLSKNTTNDLSAVDCAEHIKLWLPSELPTAIRHLVCSGAAVSIELDLLLAEVHDCVAAIRKQRRAHNVIRTNIRGDWKAGSEGHVRTRRQRKISDIGAKIEKSRLRYDRARKYAINIDPGGSWVTVWRVLERKDIRGPNPSDDVTDLAIYGGKGKTHPAELGQGTYEQSWIWLVKLNDTDEPNESLRLHWCKTSANAERWVEELELVQEEMRRVLAYFVWRAQWWNSQVGRRPDEAQDLQDALDSHTRRQFAIYHDRVVVFASTWIPELAWAGHTPDWAQQYHSLIPSHAWKPRKRGQNLLLREYIACSFFITLSLNVLVSELYSGHVFPGACQVHILCRPGCSAHSQFSSGRNQHERKHRACLSGGS
jgi:hypothetical protein